MPAIDLYSGIGGWTLGFRMAGIPVISSYEWWEDANLTHNRNFGTDHGVTNIRELDFRNLPNPEDVDFVVGSPPCTQFSFANRGGNGNIEEGLKDIVKFLEVVEHLQPRYWAMENVPRVANIIDNELSIDGRLYPFRDLFENIRVYDSADFGVPQNRKRMIAGRLPFNLLDSYRNVTPRLTLGNVLDALNTNPIVDPIYGINLTQEQLTDNIKESPLNQEEARLNRESKTHHPVYNRMSFPDRLDRPSRTITALCTRVSRESIVIEDQFGNLRRLTVREKGCIQSFPINFQFFSKSYSGKVKMIGNAVPPILTFYIAQSMLETTLDNLLFPNQVALPLPETAVIPPIYAPDTNGVKYPLGRSFRMAIPGLRFGSGVRFELRNQFNSTTSIADWRVNFFYGNSKKIKEKVLERNLHERIIGLLNNFEDSELKEMKDNYLTDIENLDFHGLQLHWSNRDRERTGPIEIVDKLSIWFNHFKNSTVTKKRLVKSIKLFVEEELKNGNGSIDNKKLAENVVDVFYGMLIGSGFNVKAQS